MRNLKYSGIIFIVIVTLYTFFLGGCGCQSSREKEYEIIAMKKFINNEGRRKINRPLVYGVKDIRFKGRSISKETLNKYNGDGKRALRDKNFRIAIEAISKNDYRNAEKYLGYASSRLPSNEYITRWKKRVKLFRSSKEADSNIKIKAAERMIDDGEPESVISNLNGLTNSKNLFVRKKVFYYRSLAHEMMGKEEEAMAERLVSLTAAEKIGELDAESFVFPVDTSK